MMEELANLLECAVEKRAIFLDKKHESAFRLFNGFLEGFPDLVVDIYAKCLLIHWYGKEEGTDLIAFVFQELCESLDWVENVLVKSRADKDRTQKNGKYLLQKSKTSWIKENDIRYSVDLTMNRDASFYLDTRALRYWLQNNSKGRSVLNTFAYTGSLGVAAVAGGATRVVQCDLNKSFLNVAKTSYTLNGFPIKKSDFQVGDFWKHMNVLKRRGEKFDTIIVDPPFFADTKGGRVDLAKNTISMINKVRPLVRNGGKIIFVNNALFVSGKELEDVLNTLYDTWISLDSRIDVDSDFHGPVEAFVRDPSPYNHSTKITILNVIHSRA